jgi:hypothetical protein
MYIIRTRIARLRKASNRIFGCQETLLIGRNAPFAWFYLAASLAQLGQSQLKSPQRLPTDLFACLWGLFTTGVRA